MPDGQGVWHFDDEVNICNTYIWLFLFLYIYMYIYIYLLYLWPSCTCHLQFVLLLLLCCCCFLSLSLVFVVCCLWYRSSGSFDFLVLLLCCELTQSGVVGSGWSFFFGSCPCSMYRTNLLILISSFGGLFFVLRTTHFYMTWVCICIYIHIYIGVCDFLWT